MATKTKKIEDKYKPNQFVVHPHHGAAKVVRKVNKNVEVFVEGEPKSKRIQYFEIEVLMDGLTVMVPVDTVDEVIRPVISKSAVSRKVFPIFKEKPEEAGTNWSRWYKVLTEKMTSGDVMQVAEVVRDLTHAQINKGISPALKRMLAKARTTLASEVACALDIDEEAAVEKLINIFLKKILTTDCNPDKKSFIRLELDMFIGTGWDIHKHSNSKPLTLGGVAFDEDGFEAHSDGDILLHALIDAILGATSNKDIGHYFPSNEKTPLNIASTEMLKSILEEINFSIFKINNIDMTIISQKINISSKSEVIEENISKLLSFDKNRINLKGKSVDKLGIIGNNEASAAFVSISLTDA